jgi:uncharacterized protein YcfJ
MRGGIDSFRQLQAQMTTQLVSALKLPSSKAVAVQMTMAVALVVSAMHAPEAQAGGYPTITQTEMRQLQAERAQDAQYAQQEQGAKPSGMRTVIGAGVGGLAGNLLGKITHSNRKVTTVVGALVGGLIGSAELTRDEPAGNMQCVQQQLQRSPLPRLSADRDRQLAAMQTEATQARAAYVTTLAAAKEAEIDKSLMPNDKAAQQRYQSAVIEASRDLREDRAATKTFTDAVRALAGQYNVSEYSAAFAKLRQPARIGDASYGQLAACAADIQAKKEVAAEVESGLRSNQPVANTMF